MNHVIIINPRASYVRKNPNVRRDIHVIAGSNATILEPASVSDLVDHLDDLSKRTDFSRTTLYPIGGDGTFNVLLNWLMKQSINKQAILVPIGGGQFNFMSKHVHFPSSNPAENLRDIFLYHRPLIRQEWSPIQMHDSHTEEIKYAAVFANGVVFQVARQYNEQGKGNILGVGRVILSTVSQYIQEELFDTLSDVHSIFGKLIVDEAPISSSLFAGIVISAVDEFVTLCRPFKNRISSDLCAVFAYWGNLGPLAMSIPLLWTGLRSPLTDHNTFNANAHKIRFQTRDNHLILDGDVFSHSPLEESPVRTFTFSRGQSIRLSYAI